MTCSRIEQVKKAKKGKEEKMAKLKKDYEKADLKDRIDNYSKKAVYEELTLKELKLYSPVKGTSPIKQDD